MKKKFRVMWNETYLCDRVVEAENEEEALEMVQNDEYNGTAVPDKKEFGGYDCWECRAED